jgi:hypothetical protein
MKQIEAEGGELLIQNSLGSYAIIPKKDVETLRNYILKGCHDCIDKYVTSLPSYETAKGKAEDGILLTDDPENPNPKIKEARDWLNNWYWDRKMPDKASQDLLEDSSDTMNEFIADVPTYARRVFTDTNATVMDSDILVNRGEESARGVLGVFNGESIEYADGVQSSNVPLHELTHAGDSKMGSDLLSNQERVIYNNTKSIDKVSETGLSQRFLNAKGTIPEVLKGIDEKYKSIIEQRLIEMKNDGIDKDKALSVIGEESEDNILNAINEYRNENPLNYEKTKPLMAEDANWEHFFLANNANKISGKLREYIKKKSPQLFRQEAQYIQEMKGDATYYNNYIKDFDEVHARIMEIRKDLDIKPDQVINQKFIDDNRDKLKKNDAYLDIMEVTREGDASLINLLNKLVDVGSKNDSGIKNS